ncbi:MAG: hypothetical protein M1823_000365 [Watsoniomyces obsoletus]|nr:MAG: hypothetical protein M1823_000365 [Watsoniomyces obsoletus]
MPTTLTGASTPGVSSTTKMTAVAKGDDIIEPDSNSATSDDDDGPNRSVIAYADADGPPSDVRLSTLSLTQSVLNYPTENGRRYHRLREGSYPYPNDEMEIDRLELHHDMARLAMGGREFFAPLDQPRKMLDVGTGTGRWPLEMAEFFPDCEIIGTDLSAIQPVSVPPNVQFVLDDANEDDWLYPPNSFDYIHTRMMLGCFEDFRQIINKSFKYIRPGGWMESQEFMTTVYCDDGTMPPDWPYLEWTRTLDEAAMQIHRPLRIANKLKKWFREAGFVDVHEEVFKVPCNPWPKEPHMKDLGRIEELNFLEGVQGFSMANFHRAFHWTKEEIEVYLVNVRKAVRDRNVHAYHKVLTGTIAL